MSQQNVSILAIPVTLTGAVSACRFVGNGFSQAAADANTLGVARSSGAAGDKVTVDVLGTGIVETGAAISAGQAVKSDAQGRAIPWAVSGAKVGIALQPATAAGQFIEILLIPNA